MLMQEAHADVRLANTALAAHTPSLVAIGGFSGSGKSTVAAALAPRLGAPPGARILSSDRLRKALFGVAATHRLPADAYAPDVSQKVYALARDHAAQVLGAGASVIADAVFDHEASRAAIAAIAQNAGASFHGVWLDADASALADRVERRRGDPSDATASVLQTQIQSFAARSETMDWRRHNATQPADTLAAQIAASLEQDAT
jgi:predicted kinase